MASAADTISNIALLAAVGGVAFVVWRSSQAAKDIATAVNPASRENVVNKAANKFVSDQLGGQLTIGERFFRAFNPDEAEALCRAGETKFCTNSGSKDVKMPTGFADASNGGLRKFEGIILN